MFHWRNMGVRLEAEVLFQRDRHLHAELLPLITRLNRGTLRKSKDYKQIQLISGAPILYELTLNTSSPPVRLYFIEESHESGVQAIGLLLAVKPRGTLDQQRAQQNRDAERAYRRRQA